jgi:hypothetical protein
MLANIRLRTAFQASHAGKGVTLQASNFRRRPLSALLQVFILIYLLSIFTP